MSRLTDPPPGYPQPPLAYLLGCYARASAASRSLPALSDKQALAQLQATVAAAKALVVSYAGLMLTMDMFPQVEPLSSSTAPKQQLCLALTPQYSLRQLICGLARALDSPVVHDSHGLPQAVTHCGGVPARSRRAQPQSTTSCCMRC